VKVLRVVLALLLACLAFGPSLGCSSHRYTMAKSAPAADPVMRGALGGMAYGVRGPGGPPRDEGESSAAVALAEPQAPPAPARPDVPAPVPGTPPIEQPKQKIAPLLIYTAVFEMAVFEARQAIDNVEGYAREIGGYLVRREDNAITVRVPAEKYREALAKVTELGDVLHRQESVEDVTDQYYDMEAHLKNARALRDRLEELLKQAKDVKEALLVEQELARVTGEIEALQGKLKRLRELINFSTITVRFQPKSGQHVEPKVRLPFPWLDQLGLPHLRNL
jgi:hypothetical protein